MSKKVSKKTGKKKVVVASTAAKKVAPTTSRRRSSSATLSSNEEMIFGPKNYTLMAIGAGLIFLGLIFMMGGQMPDPNTWDPDIIYSKRITVLGPFTILAGLIVEIVAIFRK